MFLTCDNGLISAIFLRNLCVQKNETCAFVTQPVRNHRPVWCDLRYFRNCQTNVEEYFLAHRIRVSACFTWTDSSYLNHVISPRTV